jgi:hypothetical protein
LTDPGQFHYAFFGLQFLVDRPLTGLRPSAEPATAGVRVTSANTELDKDRSHRWRPRYRGPEFTIDDHSSGEWLRIRYEAGPLFDLNKNGSEIRVTLTPSTSPEDLVTYLLGPVAGLLLYLRGRTCLHASAIAFRGKALVFVGAAEAGKSTLAAAFARKGYGVLTDDILGLDRDPTDISATPGLPRIGLWPPSVENLWGDADALPRQAPPWDKRYVDLVDQGLFQDAPLPIGAVYLLDEREPNARLRIEPLAGTEAMLALIANKYVTRISEREQNRRDFVLLSELAASVPVRRITRRDALTDLHATCEAILTDYDALALAPA